LTRYRSLGAALVALGTGTACFSYNYTSPLGPRYVGAAVPQAAPAAFHGSGTLRVATFNMQYARQVDRTIALIESTPTLRDADVITLQEMDAPATKRIAAALHMAYVYYPASIARKTRRDFGNAILSRWPIVADEKIVLPHHARFEGTQRIATAATIVINGLPIRVYSVHLATQIELGPGSRREQVRAILTDAAGYPRVVASGDMNSHGVGSEFKQAGFEWVTEHNPSTHHFWNFDHVFLKGLAPGGSPTTGVVHDNMGASDHRPVWAIAFLPPPPQPPSITARAIAAP
jgi:endonuclease/exonuclease/phosphatase family metal-dependent hydrolase